jgi:eukaryotic-like serine/threonine-protein kinase
MVFAAHENAMPHENWERIQEIFLQAADVHPSERAAFLDRMCGVDIETRMEVESLLRADTTGESELCAAIESEVASMLDESWAVDTRLGSYRLLKEIGRGGMGTVYLAERADGQFRKQVAVKMVRPGMDTEFILARFRRERQVLGRLDHPNIGRLLDGGTATNGAPYFVMEYIDGDWITRHCESKGLGVEQRLRMFLRVCSAVHYAHLQFVVHRDLKPGNILVDSKGEPKLLDFGICKLLYRAVDGEDNGNGTSTIGTPLLTPQYACPEQIRGEPVTIASDVYSLGAVFYELLTGAHPHIFPELTPQVVEKVVCERDVIAPSEIVRRNNEKLAARLRGDLDTIVLHAMHKEPSRRYATVERFAEDIRRHLSDQPITARPDDFAYRSRKFLRRNRLAVGVGLALLIAFGAGLFSGELRHRLVPRGHSPLTTDNQAGSRLQRVELLTVLGDSYAREHNWKEALLAYGQAQAQIPSNPSTDEPAVQALRDRISTGIALAREQQGISEKK